MVDKVKSLFPGGNLRKEILETTDPRLAAWVLPHCESTDTSCSSAEGRAFTSGAISYNRLIQIFLKICTLSVHVRELHFS